MRAILIAAVLLSTLACRAETPQSLIPKAQEAFEKYAPGSAFHGRAIAFGDINGDGIDDFVTFTDQPRRIAVFLGTRDGTFTFHEVSSDVSGDQPPYLEIRKQSIFLHWDASGGCCSHWAESFQFKMHRGRLMLIGLETAIAYPEDDDGVPMGVDRGVSANLITGYVIRWSGTGKTRTEEKSKLPSLKPVTLQDFSYDTFQAEWDVLFAQ